MRVIITKYATTSGVQIREGSEGSPGMLFCSKATPTCFDEYFHGKDWHKDKFSAVSDVQLRFNRKRKSLEQQLRNLGRKEAVAVNAINASGL